MIQQLHTKGYFGPFGGRYVPEVLIPALQDLEQAYAVAKKDPAFRRDFKTLLQTFCGRPTPLTYAARLTEHCGGAQIYLKNEGANVTGAHKITHCIGQALLAKRMGKARLIAETGAGQHGLATATVAAKFGLDCTIFMGRIDMERQRPNVFMMQQLGAEVVPVDTGGKTLKDAVTAATQEWIKHPDTAYYLLGSALGPHPYPSMVRYFQAVVGVEVKRQLAKLPDVVIACVGGGSNAIGAFGAFARHTGVRLIGVEAGGRGPMFGEHASRFNGGSIGIAEGYKSVFLQTEDGQLQPTHSIAAGLDYPGIGPELAALQRSGRVEFTSATDAQALAAFKLTATHEGILPALESCHALAEAIRLAPTLRPNQTIVVNVSGRGDKDLFILADAFADDSFYSFLKQEVHNHDQSHTN